MLLPHWHVETTAGESREATGPEGWTDCLSHDDVTEPGRIRCLRLTDAHGPIELQLQADERLVFARRRRRVLDPEHPGPLDGSDPSDRTILGIARPDGSGCYAFVTSDGEITLTSDFHAAL